MRIRVAILAAALVIIAGTESSRAYSLLGIQWPSSTAIIMQLQLGSSSPLSDGSTDWNASMDAALSAWNGVLSGSGESFQSVLGSSAAVAQHNSLNNVFFSNDVYGSAWGAGVLAITLTTYQVPSNISIESDMLFNQTLQWDSYRGNLRSRSGSPLYDIRRVALHESGHVLGLDHPDQHAQTVAAIMNSTISNLDSLQTDDIDGAHAIYGGTGGGGGGGGTGGGPGVGGGTHPMPPGNNPPTVSLTCSPCSVGPGATSELTANASDAEGDALFYSWSTQSGRFTTSTTAKTTWTAPNQPTSNVVTVYVQDSRGGLATASVTLQVVVQNSLAAGAQMLPGESLTSANRQFRLLYQLDGNLVLYDDSSHVAVWSSVTSGMAAGRVSMQPDGNLVVYDAAGQFHWATSTSGSTGARMMLQNDGNMVIYDAANAVVWDRVSNPFGISAP